VAENGEWYQLYSWGMGESESYKEKEQANEESCSCYSKCVGMRDRIEGLNLKGRGLNRYNT